MPWHLRREDIDAVVLDVGGVLTLPEPDHLRPVLGAADLVVSDDLVHEAHYHGVGALGSADSPDWSGYFTAVARHCGAGDRSGALVEALAEASHRTDHWRRVAPGAREGLRALDASGVALGLVSNSDGTVEEGLRALELCQVGPGPGVEVRVIIDSQVVGVAKPDPAIFAMALEKLGVLPERAVYVGDTVQWDVAGARGAGLIPVHFDPHGCCLDNTGHRHAASLLALAEQLTHPRS